MSEVLLDILLRSPTRNLIVRRTDDHDHIVLLDNVRVFPTPVSAVETIQFLGTLFRKPMEEGVIVETRPAYGTMNSLKVTEVGGGLYNVDVGTARMGEKVPSEQVMKIMGGYLEVGGVIRRDWDDVFWGADHF